MQRPFGNLRLAAVVILGTSSIASAADAVLQPPEPESQVLQAESGLTLSGLVEGWAGGSFVATRTGTAIEGGEKDGLLAYGADARIMLGLPSGWFTQADLNLEGTNNNQANNNFDGGFLGAGHFGWRSQDHLLGGFAGYGQALSETNGAHYWFVGGEGQLHLNNTTLYGQVGYLDSTDDETGAKDFIHGAFFVRGQARYFVSDTARLTGELSYAAAHEGSNDAATNIFGWGLRFDKTLAGWPASIFAAYNGVSYGNGIGSYVDNVVKVGLQFKFGSSGDQDFERNGASLDLPSFGRWVAAGNSID